jgi:hypothetical protein
MNAWHRHWQRAVRVDFCSKRNDLSLPCAHQICNDSLVPAWQRCQRVQHQHQPWRIEQALLVPQQRQQLLLHHLPQRVVLLLLAHGREPCSSC